MAGTPCRAMEKGGLDVLISVMDTEDAACCAAASSALSALADADSDILQKLGVERLVSMAVRAETPPMRAATITFVSKLARDSDTHEPHCCPRAKSQPRVPLISWCCEVCSAAPAAAAVTPGHNTDNRAPIHVHSDREADGVAKCR